MDETVSRSMISRATVIEKIREAFKDVTLDGGIGLSEAEAMDNYATAEQRALCRMTDEQLKWENISAAELNKNNCSLSYFDAKGMRFHLPAFMIAEINGTFNSDIYQLVSPSEYNQEQLALLSPQQREAVRSYLQYCAENDIYTDEEVRDAIDNYGRKCSEP
jgi:hypothetical protein